MHPEPPTHIKTFRHKGKIDDKNDFEPWHCCEMLQSNHFGIDYKYCFIGSSTQKPPYPFIRYDLFLPISEIRKQEKIEHYNSPEALLLTNYVNFLKLNSGCIRCGFNEHAQGLLFDHINPADKKFDIANMLNKYRKTSIKNRPRIFVMTVEEIKKCQVMCSNCHLLKTHDNRCGVEKLRTYYTSPEDYLIKNNKLPIIYINLEPNEYFTFVSDKYENKYKHIIENKQLMLL